MPQSRDPRVLVVDDNKIVRGIISETLTEAGFDVCGQAENGVAAIERAKQLDPDLVLMDLRMPEMNGAEAASVLKRMLPRVRVLVFTLFDGALGKSLASAVGADVVLSKSAGASELVRYARALTQ